MDYIKHIIQQKTGVISPKDEEILMLWVKESEENEKLYKEYVSVWDKTGEFSLDFSKEKTAAKSFLESHIQDTKIRKFTIWKIAVAASLLLLLGNVGWNYWVNDSTTPTVFANVYSTNSSSQSFVLADQSEIILGPNSEVKYSDDFNHSNRTISLKGSLFVDVTKNENLPFIVQAEGFKVSVLGTAFQISELDDEQEAKVSVIRGLVEVSTDEMKVNIRPQEAVVVNTNSKQINQSEFSTNDIAHFSKPIIFDNTSLLEVAQVLESKFDIQIEILQDEDTSCKFTGTFQRQDLEEILTIIQKATSLKWSKVSDTNYIWRVNPC